MKPTPRLNQIYVGDAEQVLRTWPTGFVDMCLTSPPYFQMRDYGHADQLGLEETPDQYVRRLLGVMREVRRVLKPDGSLYLNLGDTYRKKSLLGIPWRVARALGGRGWYLRNAIVWYKPHGMPSAIKDRLTTRYELVFHFTRSRRYYFDLDAIRVPHDRSYGAQGLPARLRHGVQGLDHRPGRPVAGGFIPDPRGKNPGDVWSIGPETRPKRFIAPVGTTEHFAPFPEALCERPILAGSPEGGIVLDPFIGSGTTALVARRLGRKFLGIELVEEYAALTRARLRADRCDRSLSPRCHRTTRKALKPRRNVPNAALSFSDERGEAA